MGPWLRLDTGDESGEGKRVSEGRRRVIGEKRKSQRQVCLSWPWYHRGPRVSSLVSVSKPQCQFPAWHT